MYEVVHVPRAGEHTDSLNAYANDEDRERDGRKAQPPSDERRLIEQ